jgi:hypothetical protein
MHLQASPISIPSVSASVEPTDPSVAIALSADPESNKLLITLIPPKQPTSLYHGSTTNRAALNICCVIDVSGSMGSEAPIPGDPAKSGQVERTGLSVLDVVKHSLRTIIATMKEGKDIISACIPTSHKLTFDQDDRIALVTFSNSAEVGLK